MKILIIGSGIFGSIIATQLQKNGADVLIVDCDEPMAGSKPAACLMKPSWYSSLGPEAYRPAMETLERLYNVENIEFETGIAKTTVKWIDPKTILNKQAFRSRIIGIIRSDNSYLIAHSLGEIIADKIIIAAGIWCNALLTVCKLPFVPELSPKTGTSFTTAGICELPKISVWRPYTQLVRFQITPEHIWVGDGGSYKKYTEEHQRKSLERCANFIESPINLLTPATGHRPYVKDAKPCYLKEHAPGIWVVTGGAKNGTIAAGWAAWKLSKELL